MSDSPLISTTIQADPQTQPTIQDRFKNLSCRTGHKMDPEKMLSNLNEKISANPQAAADVQALLTQAQVGSLKEYFDANKSNPDAIKQLFALLKQDGVAVPQPHHRGHHGHHVNAETAVASKAAETDPTKF